MKKALITGVNGQDGSYLAEFLLDKGYEVWGTVRRASTFNRWRLHKIYKNAFERHPNFFIEYADLSDSSSLVRVLNMCRPDEIYNLAAQSHVQVSFETPEYTADIDGLGTLKMIEAMRILGLEKTAKFYQASTSELFGKVAESIQNEDTPFYPRSPYGVAKLYAFWIVKNYREAYGLFGVNGILFNHESPRRGENFVSKKITQGLVDVKFGRQDVVSLGNLSAKRDWGYAKDYVEAMWLMLQQDVPQDFVIATGETHSVREFVEETCSCLGINLVWHGSGKDEVGIDQSNGKVIIKLNDRYLRPTEVDCLQGDISRARKILGWEPNVKFRELVKIMVDYDLENLKNNCRILID